MFCHADRNSAPSLLTDKFVKNKLTIKKLDEQFFPYPYILVQRIQWLTFVTGDP